MHLESEKMDFVLLFSEAVEFMHWLLSNFIVNDSRKFYNPVLNKLKIKQVTTGIKSALDKLPYFKNVED